MWCPERGAAAASPAEPLAEEAGIMIDWRFPRPSSGTEGSAGEGGFRLKWPLVWAAAGGTLEEGGCVKPASSDGLEIVTQLGLSTCAVASRASSSVPAEAEVQREVNRWRGVAFESVLLPGREDNEIERVAFVLSGPGKVGTVWHGAAVCSGVRRLDFGWMTVSGAQVLSLVVGEVVHRTMRGGLG